MTPVLLVDALKSFAEEVVKNYWLETNHKNLNKEPQVLTGFLPPKKSTNIPDHPFVIVRLLKGKDSSESTVDVKIIVGTYSEDAQLGWRDVANIIERIRQELLKRRVIDRKYSLELPLEWEIPESQPYPEWVGFMNTKWSVASPALEGLFYEES